MAITLVQTGGNTSNFASTAVSMGNTTTGNLIVVGIYTTGMAANNVSSVTDSQSNSYTQIFSDDGGSGLGDLELWYATNITGGTTPTITVAYANSTFNMAIAREYSGLDTLSPLDQHSATSYSNQTTPASGNVTTTIASELVVGVLGEFGTGGTISAGTNYGNLSTQTNSNILGIEDQILSSTATLNATFGFSSTQSGSIGIATFKAAATVAPTQAPPLRIPNKNVGPMALRKNFHQPYYPTAGSAPVVASTTSSTLPLIGVG